MTKWVAVEEARAGLPHAVVCPNVTGSKMLVLVCSPLLTSHKSRNLYLPGVWFADAMTPFYGTTSVLFCFVFVFMLWLKPRPFV